MQEQVTDIGMGAVEISKDEPLLGSQSHEHKTPFKVIGKIFEKVVPSLVAQMKGINHLKFCVESRLSLMEQFKDSKTMNWDVTKTRT